MARLIGYISASNTLKSGTDDGFLAKAMCSFCGRKYGSAEEANRCERTHLDALIRPELNNNIFRKEEQK